MVEIDDELLIMPGYDDCIAGIVYRCGNLPIVCYDYNKVIAQLQNDGMTYEEAIEFYEFNQLGSWVGESTPCFIHLEERPMKGD